MVELPPQAAGPARLYDATGRACPGLAPRSWRLWGIRRWHADPVADDLLLRRTWWQPGTDDDAHRAAVALRGRLESPFPPDDTLFLWADQPADGGRQVHALWASRRLLQQRHPQHWQTGSRRLLWVELPPATDRWVPLPTPAQRAMHRWRNTRAALNAAAWLLALAAVAALAVTPSWQLRQRAIDAQAQWAQLQQQAAPALASRQQLTVAMEHIDAFDRTTAALRDPVALLDWITAQLPDDTHVSDLEQEGDTLRLQGLTPNAAALMRRLGDQPGVAAVTASRPATKVTGLGKESYFIEIRFAPVPLAPPAAPGAPAQP
ncbi:PilN domain-containing protein [Tepidimonas fonticaldi]|uniref:PilN domain-containing protein n=1 Tax=Tepidimonas fonticaldi TaxID=1101373 RepID=UPI0018D3BE4F|nr:PilN domain-containing protein [Tepidimonas fonticaldi]